MIENDTQNSRQAASAALRNAPKLAKIAQAGVQGGPAGAAAEAVVQYRKEVLVVVIAVTCNAAAGLPGGDGADDLAGKTAIFAKAVVIHGSAQ